MNGARLQIRGSNGKFDELIAAKRCVGCSIMIEFYNEAIFRAGARVFRARAVPPEPRESGKEEKRRYHPGVATEGRDARFFSR
jgi:hypothetical protein